VQRVLSLLCGTPAPKKSLYPLQAALELVMLTVNCFFAHAVHAGCLAVRCDRSQAQLVIARMPGGVRRCIFAVWNLHENDRWSLADNRIGYAFRFCAIWRTRARTGGHQVAAEKARMGAAAGRPPQGSQRQPYPPVRAYRLCGARRDPGASSPRSMAPGAPPEVWARRFYGAHDCGQINRAFHDCLRPSRIEGTDIVHRRAVQRPPSS